MHTPKTKQEMAMVMKILSFYEDFWFFVDAFIYDVSIFYHCGRKILIILSQ